MQGYTVAIYIDDIIAIDQSFEESPCCGKNNKFVSKTGFCNTFKKRQFHNSQKNSNLSI